MKLEEGNPRRCLSTAFLLVTLAFGQARAQQDRRPVLIPGSTDKAQAAFDFAAAPQVNVATVEELYSAVNNSANVNSQVVMAAGVYVLSAMDSGGAARPNGGRLELQENMALRGVAGSRAAVVIDAMNLPAGSYSGELPATGAVRMGKGTNAIEWMTLKNAFVGGVGIIVHLSAPGTTSVRIAHCAVTGNLRGIDIRNVAGGSSGYVIEAELVDNDLYSNRIGTGQGIRIINSQGVSGNSISAYLSGNRMFDNQQGLLVENIGSTNAGVVSIYSSGDRFFGNGGGAFIGGALGPTNNSTVNFTAVGSVFENNNGFTDFFRGGLNVAGGASFMAANGGSNNTANVVLRNCRFANNQVADLAVYGAVSLPVTVGPSGTNNRANVRLFGTPISNVITADSSPANPSGANSVNILRSSIIPNSDYDGDGRSDISVFRPSDRTWYINASQNGFTAAPFGLAADKLVPADFDGDGKIDIAVFRDGVWYWLNSSDNQINIFQFGVAGDIPRPADFDGDGRAEITVWRRSDENFRARWYVYNLATNRVTFVTGDESVLDMKPISGDYDGDGRADYGYIWSAPVFHWIVPGYSGSNPIIWGTTGDLPVPADYDGDGKTDAAVFRPSEGNWYIRRSIDGNSQIINWGVATDAPVPADYDGDGKADVAVFRNGTWWLNQSTSGVSVQQFGLSGDKPVPAAFLP